MTVDSDEKDHNLVISSQCYIEKTLPCYGTQDMNTAVTPMDPNFKLVPIEPGDEPADKEKYQQMVRSITYAAITTRPDIAYASVSLWRFNAMPTITHMTAA